jgi:hypothetical protein
VFVVNGKLNTICLIFGRSKYYKFVVLGCSLIAGR